MIDRLADILNTARIHRSDILPSIWAENNRVMTSAVSPRPGRFSYEWTPYTREIVDCLHPSHPSKRIAIMKGAQVGFSTGVIEPGIGWIISQNPGNILFLTGHSDLSEEAINKVDHLIDSCGIRHLIRPSVLRSRNSRTGDTNKAKEFPGGSLVSGSATNHKLLRQRSVRYGFIDDFEAAHGATKESGSTEKMIEQRFAAYSDKMKLFFISTPERKETSNIYPVYLKGDQRFYNVPCQCCGAMIPLKWEVEIIGTDGKEKGGVTWKVDSSGKLIFGSVGYVCQECGGFFTDQNKYDFLLAGRWVPTATPVDETYFSYHLSSLYAPHGMFNWEHYVRQYLEANPPGQPQKEHLQKTFVNLALGDPFESTGEAPKANAIQKNVRNYEIGIIPERLSIADGNGRIVMVTCAADMNGKEDDARLDYEIVAWAESGASYSVKHGSVGTFVPREASKRTKADRLKWTYEENKKNSVWPEFEKVLSATYAKDDGSGSIGIFISGLDCGHYTSHAYTFLDKTNYNVMGLRGEKENKYLPLERNIPTFKPGRERSKYFLLDVSRIKDTLSDYMRLNWDEGNEDQPSGYMNFPQPAGGLYGFSNYFEHFESEHRVVDVDATGQVSARWVKKNSAVQNHMFDCRVYNMALRDILVYILGKEAKRKDFTWRDYVDMIAAAS